MAQRSEREVGLGVTNLQQELIPGFSRTAESVERAEWGERVVGPDEVMLCTSTRLPRSLMQRVRQRAAEAGCRLLP